MARRAKAEAEPDATPARTDGPAVARGLLGLGLGLGELLAPRALLDVLGAGEGPLTPGVLRGLGARELVVGAGLLTGRRTAPWLWARVASDVVDLALLASALRANRERDRGRLLGALAAVAGVTALDAFSAVTATREERSRVAAPVRRSVTIRRARADVYKFWRNLANAPRFMAHIESVEIVDAKRSRWSARGPVGPVVSWEAVIDEDRANERFSWRSVEGAEVRTEGAVSFESAPGGRGTEVRLVLRYGPGEGGGSPPWKAAAAAQLDADLRRCKQLLETGHVVHSDAPSDAARAPEPASPNGAPVERRDHA